jgi:SAM-dependent methyltransferase
VSVSIANPSSAAVETVSHCRACGSSALSPVVSLGVTPLANALLTREKLDEPEAKYPLSLAFCADCSLVQITQTVPPEVLFSDYPYFSSFSDTMVRSVGDLARRLVDTRGLGGDSLVLEVASNDGYLLQHYKQAGVPVLGIEPAANVAAAALAKGVPTRSVFFGRETAAALKAEGIAADVIHANNVLAHVPDLNGVVAGMATVLKPGGVIVIEAPYLRDMIEKVEFDTIYHEHLCYFSISALTPLFARHGLTLADVERLPIHGGSLRLFFAKGNPPVSPAVVALAAEEKALGMLERAYYDDFARRIDRLRDELTALLRKLKAEGKSVAAYGASAKGSTLLNVFGIGADLLDFVADRSTVKQGRFTPGSHLPIVAPEELLNRRPDYVLLLSWNFADEILAQQAAYRELGGRFIIPVPQPQIV